MMVKHAADWRTPSFLMCAAAVLLVRGGRPATTTESWGTAEVLSFLRLLQAYKAMWLVASNVVDGKAWQQVNLEADLHLGASYGHVSQANGEQRSTVSLRRVERHTAIQEERKRRALNSSAEATAKALGMDVLHGRAVVVNSEYSTGPIDQLGVLDPRRTVLVSFHAARHG